MVATIHWALVHNVYSSNRLAKLNKVLLRNGNSSFPSRHDEQGIVIEVGTFFRRQVTQPPSHEKVSVISVEIPITHLLNDIYKFGFSTLMNNLGHGTTRD